MPCREPLWWTPPRNPISEFGHDTLPTERLSPEPDLGDDDTIAVPLTSAETLPCLRLAVDELPTLRAAPAELAALVRMTQPPPAPHPTPIHVYRPVLSQAAGPLGVCQSDSGQTMPLSRVPPAATPLPVLARPQPARGPLDPRRDRPPKFADRPALKPDCPRNIGHMKSTQLNGGDAMMPTQLRGGDAMMPTQLWLGPVAPFVAPAGARSATPSVASAVAARTVAPAKRSSPGPRAPRSLWARLWSLLGFAASPKPGYRHRHRHRSLRR